MYYELELETPFDTAYGVIKLPENMIVYRGYSNRHPALSERFAYFSEKQIANSYVKSPDYVLSAFTNTRVLRLLDVRFMTGILREMIYSNPSDESTLPIILSFGLCSLKHQVHLLNKRYAHPESRVKGHTILQTIVDGLDSSSLYERQGVRIGETTNDAYTMAFLSKLFENYVDGFVSPRLYSPYHHKNTMAPELILFNPIRSGIRQLSSFPPASIPIVSMHRIYMTQIKHNVLRYVSNISGYQTHIAFHAHPPMVGGGDIEKDIPIIEQINMNWDDENIQTAIKNGIDAALKWNERIYFGMYDAPVPKLKVSSWTTKPQTIEIKPINKTRKLRNK